MYFMLSVMLPNFINWPILMISISINIANCNFIFKFNFLILRINTDDFVSSIVKLIVVLFPSWLRRHHRFSQKRISWRLWHRSLAILIDRFLNRLFFYRLEVRWSDCISICNWKLIFILFLLILLLRFLLIFICH